MDHEVVPKARVKTCDWPLNLSRDHFGLHQGINDEVTMDFEVPKRHVLRASPVTLHLRLHLRFFISDADADAGY